MSKQVRLGRKETRRSRTAQEQQTYERHKRASKRRKRESRSADFDALFEKYGLPSLSELDAVQDALIDEYRFGSITAADYPAAIFGPALDDMTRLPLGLLDEKEVALPHDMISDRRADLVRLCRRLIIRNEDGGVIGAILAGMPGSDREGSILRRHVTDLLRLSIQRPAVFRAIVSSQHKGALIRLRDGGLPPGFTREGIERLLVVHGLLWCTNDLQMNLARAARAERNPLDGLVMSHLRQLEPTRVVNDLRPRLVLMRLLLDQYVTEEEEQGPDARVPSLNVPDDPITLGYKLFVEAHAAAKGTDIMSLRKKLDELVSALRARSRDKKDIFWQILDAPEGQARLPKHFTGVWFSGLSVVQSAAVTILRYMQAEHEIVDMVRLQMAIVFDGVGPLPEHPAMQPFARANLLRGWEKRAKTLLNLYRRELLDDKDYPMTEPSKNAGMAAITTAAEWLERQPQRRIGDHDERAGHDRRTLYLLDVIPEARLSR